MTTAVSTMVRRALESFLSAKAEVAQAVLEMDSIVDRMKDEAFINLVTQMTNHPEKVRSYLDFCSSRGPGAYCGPRHEHRRGCNFLGERR